MSSSRTITFDSVKEMTVAELLALALSSGLPLTVKLSDEKAIRIELTDLPNISMSTPLDSQVTKYARTAVYARTAMISDIHGHWEGLQLVLEDMRAREVDRIICLGDVVEGGDNNDTVVEYLKNHQITTIRGNHDDDNDCQLKTENQTWLKTLPELMIEEEVIFTHVSPRPKKQMITNHIEAWNVFGDCNFRLCFVGHTHFPAMFGKQHASSGESCRYEVDSGPYQLDEGDRYIISFGAVGYPRSGGKYLRYGIFDAPRNIVEFIRLEGPLLPYGLCR